ncbi:globin domain-containing protein [Pseudonocardia sp. N23]|uniref:globin domain-containing protein n=1 Tax=Pseudonocardia sp. N23 TaxID=1987376 RepID=UPI001558D396|nr:globin domain-containing protein [Pseudonocardia sp. N23]
MVARSLARSLSLPQQAQAPRPARRPGPEVIQAVQRSCRAVTDRPVRLAEVFYDHLFEMAPTTRAMFAADMTGQMQKMTDALLAAIAQISAQDTAELEVVLHRMGREHYVKYHVEPEHYMYVAHALTRAVRDVADQDYSSYLSSCWIAVIQWVTEHMVAGTRAAMGTPVIHGPR